MTGVQTCALPISKSIFAIYQPEDININEAILKSTQFKSKSSISEHEYSKDEFKKKLGEEHPFDYSVVEGVEKKFGLVSAIEDKICDYTLGPGIFIESKDNIEIEDYLNEWINKTNLQIYLTPWFRNGLGKGDRKSTRLNSSHIPVDRMPSSA